MKSKKSLFKFALFKVTAAVTFAGMSTSALSQTTNMRELRNLPASVTATPYMPFLSRESRERELSVRTRTSPSYDPQNVRIGEVIFAPSLKTFTEYTDNVYGTDDNRSDDMLLGVRPELNVNSDLPLHQISANFYVEDGNYKEIKEEDYTDYGASLNARYDFYQGLSLPVSIGFIQQHSIRDNPEDRRSIDPVVSRVLNSYIGIRKSGDYVDMSLGTAFQSSKFENTTSFAGTPIDNSDRDRQVVINTATIGFPVTSIVAPLLYASQKTTTYDQSVDNFGISRDSEDIEVGFGALFNITPVTKSSFRLGKVMREFDDPAADEIDALTYTLNLNWEPSTLAAFSLTGDRKIRETSSTAGANLESTVKLGMIYELSPNVILNPEIGYIKNEYMEFSEGETTAMTADMEVIYKLNPNVWTTLEYSGVTQEIEDTDTFDNEGYARNMVRLSLKLQL